MAFAIALAMASAAIEPTISILLSTSPVAIEKIVSPSPEVCEGFMDLAYPSCAIIAILVAIGLLKIALVATTPIVVCVVRPSGFA